MELETSQIKSILFDILLSPLEGENPTASPDERKNATRTRKIAECWDGISPPPPEVEMLVRQQYPNLYNAEQDKKIHQPESVKIREESSKQSIVKMLSVYPVNWISDIAKWASFASYTEAMILAALVTANPLSVSHEANDIRRTALRILNTIPYALKICRLKPTRSLLRALNDFPGIPQDIARSMVKDFLTPGERVGIFDPWRW